MASPLKGNNSARKSNNDYYNKIDLDMDRRKNSPFNAA